MIRIKKIMDFVDLVWHLAGFLAPVVAMALGMVGLGRFWWRKSAPALTVRAQLAIQLIAGCAVMVCGLVFSGHDGRMWAYAALTLVAGTVQWAMVRPGLPRL